MLTGGEGEAIRLANERTDVIGNTVAWSVAIGVIEIGTFGLVAATSPEAAGVLATGFVIADGLFALARIFKLRKLNNQINMHSARQHTDTYSRLTQRD